MRQVTVVLLLLLVTSCGSGDRLTGNVQDEQRGRSLEFHLWLPGQAPPPQGFPTVFLSHGSGGEFSNHQWLIRALQENGFAVVALNHPGNTSRDNSDKGVISVWERPADITALLDYLLEDDSFSPRINPQKLGAAGFSSGGYTALALVGAVYDADSMVAYCTGEERGMDCDLATDPSGVDYSRASLSYRDDRIKAAFAMAPAVGPGITVDSLQNIRRPVSIVSTQDDELLNVTLGAAYYAENIRGAELTLLPAGGHFLFMECNVATRVADWMIEQFDLCGGDSSVIRAHAHADIAAMAVAFFDRTLNQTSTAKE